VVRRHGGELPGQLGALALGQRVRAGDQLLQLAEHQLAQRGVALGGLGVEADDEPLVVADLDLFDLQVVRDRLVAAGSGQRRLGVGGAGAQLLAEDVAVPAGA